MDLFRINIHVTLLSGTQAMQVEYYLKNNEAECLVKWNNIFRAFVFTSLYSIQTDGIACKFYCAVLLYLHMIHFYYLEWSYSLWTDFFSSSLPPFYYYGLNLKEFQTDPLTRSWYSWQKCSEIKRLLTKSRTKHVLRKRIMLCTYILFIVNLVKILLTTAEFFCHVAKNGSTVVAFGENVVSQQIHVSQFKQNVQRVDLFRSLFL